MTNISGADADRAFQFLDLILLLRVVDFPLGTFTLSLDEIDVVITGVLFCRSRMLVDFNDPGDGSVEEVTVVGDDEDAAAVGCEVSLQPGDAREIEMVGRLVEQQEIGRPQEERREKDARLFSAR